MQTQHVSRHSPSRCALYLVIPASLLTSTVLVGCGDEDGTTVERFEDGTPLQEGHARFTLKFSPTVNGTPFSCACKFEGREVRIECKDTLRKVAREGYLRVDFQKTRASKGAPCSRFYSADQFDILAACLHPITEKWEFRFWPTSRLPPHPKCAARFATNVQVTNWPLSPAIAARDII